MITPAQIVTYDGYNLIVRPQDRIGRELAQKHIRQVEIRLVDGRTISADQRRKIYAIIRDICEWNGDEPEWMKEYLKFTFCGERCLEYFSLSDCEKTVATDDHKDFLHEQAIRKRRYGMLGGNVAYHGYQSFQAGEVTPEEAHRIGIETAREAILRRLQSQREDKYFVDFYTPRSFYQRQTLIVRIRDFEKRTEPDVITALFELIITIASLTNINGAKLPSQRFLPSRSIAAISSTSRLIPNHTRIRNATTTPKKTG